MNNKTDSCQNADSCVFTVFTVFPQKITTSLPYVGRGGSTAKSVPLMARMLRREAASRDGGPDGHVLFTSRLRTNVRLRMPQHIVCPWGLSISSVM